MRQIREHMALWEAWYRFGMPADCQPPAWEEADVFNNTLPWAANSPAHGLTEQHMRFKVYCVAQELRRSEEELEFLPQDAYNTLYYYEWQLQQLAAVICKQPALEAGAAHMLRAWRARIAVLHRSAVDAFVKLGWIVVS